MKTQQENSIKINSRKVPNVLFLGNGMLRLNGGDSWNDLLAGLNGNQNISSVIKEVPTAMQPECICGTDVEEIQRKTAGLITDSSTHLLMEKILSLPFDAILTTNYTYEIEKILCGNRWNEYQRRRAFCSLTGDCHVRHNTNICNLIRCRNGRIIPVFHIHGESARKHSMVLSYYSYAKMVHNLIEENKRIGNSYFELQQQGEMIPVRSWLDYFILGNVWTVGFGFDASEFDVWWAIERKDREIAEHGQIISYMIDDPDKTADIKQALFWGMGVKERRVRFDGSYENSYAEIINDIMAEIS